MKQCENRSRTSKSPSHSVMWRLKNIGTWNPRQTFKAYCVFLSSDFKAVTLKVAITKHMRGHELFLAPKHVFDIWGLQLWSELLDSFLKSDNTVNVFMEMTLVKLFIPVRLPKEQKQNLHKVQAVCFIDVPNCQGKKKWNIFCVFCFQDKSGHSISFKTTPELF